jgi:hypothetical protein
MAPVPHSVTSCFVSAPFGMALGVIPDVLERAGINWEWAKTERAYAEPLLGNLRKIIRGVDFVLAIFNDDPIDPNTLIEIGIAVGLGKPVMVLRTLESKDLFPLEGIPQLRTSLNDEGAIALHLDLLLRSIRKGFNYSVTRRSELVPKSLPHELDFSTPFDTGGVSESALEDTVAKIITSVSGKVTLHPSTRTVGSTRFIPDMLFWLPSLDSELLNPAVVEVKHPGVAMWSLRKTIEDMAQFLQSTNVRTGFILGPHGSSQKNSEFRSNLSVNIFYLGIEEFRQLLQTRELPAYLRRERNRAAHGLR